MITLSEEQAQLLNLIDDYNIIVEAVAGAGKTTSILELAIAKPTYNLLMITYNRALCNDSIERVNREHITNLDIYTIHSFISKLYYIACFNDKILENLLTIPDISNLITCDIFIIDECQDMKMLFYEHIVKYFSKLTYMPKLVLLGDKRQAIYRYADSDPRFLTMSDIWSFNKYPFKRIKFNTSFRIPNSVANFVNKYIIKEPKTDFIISHNKHKDPKIHIYFSIISYRCPEFTKVTNLDKPFDPEIYYNKYYWFRYVNHHIANWLEYESAKDIFILVSSTKSSYIKDLENFLVLQFKVPILVSKNDDTPLDREDMKGKIVISTFHKSKGRERKNVIVIRCDDSHFTYYDRDGFNEYTLYVATTRCINNLVLICFHDKLFGVDITNLHLIEDYIISSGRIAKYNKQDNITKVRDVTVTQLSKPQNLEIQELVEQLFTQELAPSKSIRCHKRISTIGEASELVVNCLGSALPAYYENRKYNVVPELIEQAMSPLTIERYIPRACGEAKKELMKKQKEIFNEFTDKLEHYCACAVFMDSLREGYISRIETITNYNWLTKKANINELYERMTEYIGEHKCVEFECYCKPKDEHKEYLQLRHCELNIIGKLDLVTDTHVYEFKYVDKLEIQHKLQVAIYAWLYGDSKIYKLYNIKTGESLALSYDLDILTKIVQNAIESTYDSIPINEISDDEFMHKCMKIRKKYFNR